MKKRIFTEKKLKLVHDFKVLVSTSLDSEVRFKLHGSDLLCTLIFELIRKEIPLALDTHGSPKNHF